MVFFASTIWYREVIAQLKAAGASWVQLDEPTLVFDLETHNLDAFKKAYAFLGAEPNGTKILLETHFADTPVDTYKAILGFENVAAIGVDLVRGQKTLSLIKEFGLPQGKILFAGLLMAETSGLMTWLSLLPFLQELCAVLGKGKVVVSTSCSLLHTAVDLQNETKPDVGLKSWLAFAAQKVEEEKNVAFFAANVAAQAFRQASPRVNDEAVQKAASGHHGSEHRRATPVVAPAG